MSQDSSRCPLGVKRRHHCPFRTAVRPRRPCRDVVKDSIFTRIQSRKPDGRNSMHYKPKSIGALHIALGGLPGHMRLEVEPGIALSAKTVGELRKATSWPENLVITTPQEHYRESVVRVSKASIATHYPPRR